MEVLNIGKEKLFETLGKLFYAVAACDGHIHELEALQLKQLLKFKWMSLSEEEGVSEDASVRIETEFEHLVNQNADHKQCFEAFNTYFDTHQEQFSKTLTHLIFNTAYGIANAFEGINADEKILLKKLADKLLA